MVLEVLHVYSTHDIIMIRKKTLEKPFRIKSCMTIQNSVMIRYNLRRTTMSFTEKNNAFNRLMEIPSLMGKEQGWNKKGRKKRLMTFN